MGRFLKVAIRADGNNEIGFGHIVRCIALAKEFIKFGCEVVFISKEEKNRFINNLIKEHQLRNEVIDSKITLQEEIKLMSKLVGSRDINIIILDGSQFNKEYIQKLREINNIFVVVLDVNRDINIGANVVVNGGIYAKELLNETKDQANINLLGPEYNLLRHQFKDSPKRNVNKKVKRVLITCGGGGDKDLIINIIENIIDVINKKDIQIELVLGFSIIGREELIDAIQKYKNINIHTNVTEMVNLMYQCDIAISAGGTTLYELAATGTPTIAFILANNQDRQTIEFHNQNTLINLGHVSTLNKHELVSKLNYLLNEYDVRKAMSEKGQSLIDGKGAYRTAKEIIRYYNNTLVN